MRRLALLILLTVALTPARAQVAHCDCEPALVHLCRCGVLVDQRVADIQLAYLSRLLVSEFRPYLEESPVAGVRITRSSEMYLKGEAAQGYFDNGEIVLNESLTRDQALMVLAHELGHAWHFSSIRKPDAVSDFLVEGFAEWVSYHLMKRAGLTEYCSRIKENPDPLYGKAYRWYADIEDGYGTSAVIDIMQTWLNEDGEKSERP